MPHLTITFKHKRPGGFPYPPQAVESFGEQAAVMPQKGDLYSFDGKEYFEIVERRFVTRGDLTMVELICDDHH